jgi:hypothetical protein
MKLNVLKKLIVMAILAFSTNPIFAKEITLVYQPEDADSAQITFKFPDGKPLTHELLTKLIKKHFDFSDKDLDSTTVAVVYEDERRGDIFVDLEFAGPITEFAELLKEDGVLTLTVIKNSDEDMSDSDAAYYDSGSSATASAKSDASSENLITVRYAPPIGHEECQYVYNENEYGKLTYLRLRQILLDKCNLSLETINSCFAGLSVGQSLTPIVDMKSSHSMSTQEIPDLKPGSLIYVFNWGS